jgi:hypothetical protein
VLFSSSLGISLALASLSHAAYLFRVTCLESGWELDKVNQTPRAQNLRRPFISCADPVKAWPCVSASLKLSWPHSRVTQGLTPNKSRKEACYWISSRNLSPRARSH